MFRRTISLITTTFLLTTMAATAAADPAETCEIQKRKAVAKYTACRYKADAKAAKKGTAPDYGRCIYQLETYFDRAEVRAGDGVCKSEDDVAQVMAEVDGSIGDIYSGLGGGGYPLCGNNQIDGTESCDGSALGGETCQSLGFSTGSLACTAGCGFDVSGCEATTQGPCGNGVIDENELCDGAALGGQTCQSLGYESGSLGCTAGCGFDVSGCASPTCVGGGGVLPATGQTTAYGPGSDGAVRAGAALSYTDNLDGTITDNNTGLMWEKKDDSGGIHDKDYGYSWSTGENNMDGTITTTFLATLNGGGGFAGYTDWRIPNKKELQSILDYEVYSPSVDPAFHQPATCTGCADVTLASCSCTASLSYWSSTTIATNPSFAWRVDFTDGPSFLFDKTGQLPVRAVRGGL